MLQRPAAIIPPDFVCQSLSLWLNNGVSGAASRAIVTFLSVLTNQEDVEALVEYGPPI